MIESRSPMNNYIKASLDRGLRLTTMIIVLTYLLPLKAQEPPTSATPYGRGTAQLSPSDPLTPPNAAFRDAYARLRTEILAKIRPIIIQSGDMLVLLKDGARSEAPAVTQRYHELKAVAHIPLALYVMLAPEADSKLDEAQLKKLREYRALVVQARASLEGRDFRPKQRERQLKMVDRSLAFIDTTLGTGTAPSPTLRRFTLSQSEDIQANMYEAAEDQINTMDKQLKTWLAEMTAEERKRLRVVVGAAHMPRVGNLSMQYFSVALSEPYEGRYEEEEERNSDFRLIYSESMFEEEDALRVLATHLLDADISIYFFNDTQRMHRDLLGDAGEEIIRKKFGKTPGAQPIDLCYKYIQ